MDINENHHVKQNNPGLARQIPHGFAYMWNLSLRLYYVCLGIYMCVFIGDKIQKKIIRYRDIFYKMERVTNTISFLSPRVVWST